MKKLLATIGLALSTVIATTAVASAGAYQDAYCYPTGSYWVSQRKAYPEYYQANNAYYMANYGPGTYYCN